MRFSEQPFAASAAGAHSNGTTASPNEATRRSSAQQAASQPAAGNASAGQPKLERLIAEAASLLAEPNQNLDALLTDYRAEFRPAGAHQEMLVRELAVSDWRIQQITRIETGLLWLQANDIYSYLNRSDTESVWNGDPGAGREAPPELSKASADLRTLLMGAAWLNNPKLFALLLRYHNSARRDYFRALKQLEQVRTGKAGYLPEKTQPQPSKHAAAEAKSATSETNPTDPRPGTAATFAGNQTNPPRSAAGATQECEKPSASDKMSGNLGLRPSWQESAAA